MRGEGPSLWGICLCAWLSFHPLLSGAPASLGSLTCLLGRLLISVGTVGVLERGKNNDYPVPRAHRHDPWLQLQ